MDDSKTAGFKGYPMAGKLPLIDSNVASPTGYLLGSRRATLGLGIIFMSRRPTYYIYWNHADFLNVSVFPGDFEFSGIVCN